MTEITPDELIEVLERALAEEPLREALGELNAGWDGGRS